MSSSRIPSTFRVATENATMTTNGNQRDKSLSDKKRFTDMNHHCIDREKVPVYCENQDRRLLTSDTPELGPQERKK